MVLLFLVIFSIQAAHDRSLPGFQFGSHRFDSFRLVVCQIVFLLRHRHSELDQPEPVPFESELAEPMRPALSGKSGTMVGLDYRGVKVLAAHEPVGVLNLGLVAKMDLAEVRGPFVRAGAIAGCVALLAGLAKGDGPLRIGQGSHPGRASGQKLDAFFLHEV